MPLSPLILNTVLEVLVDAIRQKKEKKHIRWGQKKTKPSLFADDMTFYTGNPRESTRKGMKLISIYNKIAGYKVNL